MEAKKHSAYKEEKKWLDATLEWVDTEHKRVAQENEKIAQEIRALKKEVNSEMDERLILKKQVYAMAQIDEGHLASIKDQPFFGRIDFKEKFQEGTETIYIGKFGLYDQAQGNMMVLDWRAPMASIYYSGLDEEVSYHTPKGWVEGKMHLKRRYVIEDREMKEIYEQKSLQENLQESITGDDDFLIEALNKTTSGRLKEIIATIQDQQNKIIRSDTMHPLIVQGVAGSGKTTIALHRMAYIIYNRTQDKNAKYMVVAPNKLFLNYIEEILPDLGVDDVYQTTFEGWAQNQLLTKFKLISEVDKLNHLLSMPKEQAHLVALHAKLRGSIIFKKIIDRYLLHMEKTIIPNDDLKYEDVLLFKASEIKEIFKNSNTHLPLSKRIKLLEDYLKKRFKDKKEIIREAIEYVYKRKIQNLKDTTKDIEAIRPEIRELYDARDVELQKMNKWVNRYIKEYIASLKLPTSIAFYQQIWDERERLQHLLKTQIDKEDLEEIIKMMLKQQEEMVIETEDLGPLLYIQMKLYGLAEDSKYSHIIVDEAQDLDEMKIVVLRQISNNDAFTFVGDLSQGIYDYKGVTNWEKMMQRVFREKKYHYYEMTTSYRSTIEIIEVANKVITQSKDFTPTLAEPVLRHGEKPQTIECVDTYQRMEKLIKQLEAFTQEGMHSISILTTTQEEAEEVYKKLKENEIQVELLGSESNKYEGQISVMPGYLSKGLEFDAVIVYDFKELKEYEARDLKLLYVMITRALHRLVMYKLM